VPTTTTISTTTISTKAMLSAVRHAFRLGHQTALVHTMSADYSALRRAWSLFFAQFVGQQPLHIGVRWFTPEQLITQAYENGMRAGQAMQQKMSRSDQMTVNGDVR